MKKFRFLLVLALQSFSVFADGNAILIESELKEVTVYLSGASLTSKGSFSHPQGMSELVFENLSPLIDANSIQAKGEGDYTILSVSFRTNYLNNQVKPREVKLLEDSLEMVQMKAETQKNLRTIFESEETFLLANKNIGGQNTGVSGVELEKIANLLRTRLPDLKAKEQECRLKEKRLNEEISKLQSQLSEWNVKRNKNTGEVVVSISAKNAGNARMVLTYMVSNAGWTPVYDLRAKGTTEPVSLDLRGNIVQNTGVDWKNVKLTLSTGNPSETGNQPVLNPWWLTFQTPVYKDYQLRGARSAPAPSRAEAYDKEATLMESDDAKKIADYAAQYVSVEENTTNYSYEVAIPYTIPTDNKSHSATIQSYSIPATYRHFCAPKLDADVFILAQITGWDKYNLLSGEMNVFFEENFIGKSILNVRSTSDTLDLSLGRDKNVTVKRTLLKDFCEKKIIGSTKKDTRMWEIAIRNKKKADINIEIIDQVPLSNNSEIEVELIESSKARYDKDSGKLSWSLKLAASEEKKLKMGYSVKFPKDKVVSNL